MSKRLVAWAYVVELLISVLITSFLWIWVGLDPLLIFLRTAALDIATLFGAVIFAGALAFLWTFFSKADTPFYRWLDSKGALQVYLRATAFTVFVSLLSTFSLVLYRHIDDKCLGVAAAFILVLALVNVYTLVSNVIGLMRLNALFIRL